MEKIKLFLTSLSERTSEGADLGTSVKPVIEKFFDIAKIVFPVFLGVVAVLIIIKLVLLGMKLAQSGDDPEERTKIIKGMIWWGVGLLIIIAGVIVSSVVFSVIVPNSN